MPARHRHRHRRLRRRGVRRLKLLGGAAAASSLVLGAGELLYLARRHDTPRDAVEVLRAGYKAGPANEASILNLFLSFGVTFGLARGVTHLIRSGHGPLGNIRIGDRHIHHFVPGIVLMMGAGGASIALRHEQIDHWLALPFGTGAALVLDEAALLLELEDVYWTEEGLLSVEIALGMLSLLASLAVVIRIVRRGEGRVTA
jgi:hypothetical protein